MPTGGVGARGLGTWGRTWALGTLSGPPVRQPDPCDRQVRHGPRLSFTSEGFGFAEEGGGFPSMTCNLDFHRLALSVYRCIMLSVMTRLFSVTIKIPF